MTKNLPDTTNIFSLVDQDIRIQELTAFTQIRAGNQVCVSDSKSETQVCCDKRSNAGDAQYGFVGALDNQRWFCYEDVGTGDWD